MKRIKKSVCIDCTETNPVQVFGISSIIDILELYNRHITVSYNKDDDTICLEPVEDKFSKIKRGSYLVLYDDKTKDILTKTEYEEKKRAQNLSHYSFFK